MTTSLNEEKELLQKIEQQYQRVLRFDAEAVRRQIAQKKYQFMKKKTEDDELERNISDLSGRLRVLDQQEKKARKAFGRSKSSRKSFEETKRAGMPWKKACRLCRD